MWVIFRTARLWWDCSIAWKTLPAFVITELTVVILFGFNLAMCPASQAGK
jgi:hypothetical protein